jgi:flagellar hook-associated protein 2
MSTISSLGVGSGLDAESIIAKLMSIEHRQVDLLQTKQTDMKSQLSTIGTLKGLLATMQDKAQALTSTTLWGQTTVSSSDATVATGTTTSGTATGSYQVTVQALAASQTVTSTALASSSTELNAGSLTIELGSWSGSSFTAKTGSNPVSITIGAGDTSLSAIRDKINAAGAGVTATIINDVNGARLSLRSTDSGAVNGFKITATETTDDSDEATGLSMLGYDPSAGTPPMSLNQAGSNARALINGIQVESASNTLSNVSDGLSLTLSKVSATPVQLTVATDTTAIKTAVNDFITAFNALASNLQTNLKYDSASKKAGPLQGDRMAVNLQWALRGVINQPSSASSVFGTLSTIGITMQQDGKLKLSSSDFDDALAKQDELKKMLTANTDAVGSSGFMTRFDDLASAMLDIEGSVTLREDGLQKAIDRNQKQQDAMEDRLTLTEKRLRAQYETLDTKMATLSTLASYISQQYGSS